MTSPVTRRQALALGAGAAAALTLPRRAFAGAETEAAIKAFAGGKTPQEGLSTLYERLMKTVGDFRVDYTGASLRCVERELEFALEEVRYLRIHTRGG